MKNNTIKWLFSVSGRKKINIVSLTVIQGLHGASGVFYALLLRRIVDSATGRDREGFITGMIMIIALVAIQLSLRALIRLLSELSRAEFENVFKKRLMDTLLSREPGYVSAVHSGEWMNRLTNDTVVVANNYVDIIPGIAEMAIKLLSALLMIVILEPAFAMILMPVGAVLIFFTWLFRKVLKRLHKNVQEADGSLRIYLQERIGSILMIRSFAAEKITAEKTGEKLEEHKKSRMKKNHFSNLCNVGFGSAMNGMYLFGVCWCGLGILNGTITFGTLTAITQLISQIQFPFANISGYLPKYYAMTASAERLMEAESFPEDEADVLSPSDTEKLYESIVSFGFDDVSFSYLQDNGSLEKRGVAEKTANMPAAVEGLTFEIGKGEYVAFTGQSGCGKSTALKLLMCIYSPDSGRRYYRNGAGEEVLLTSVHRRLFAYVPQGNALMNGSIRDVVTFARPELAEDEERLSQALKIACADEFVAELDDGADTVLGERGTGLSEGQMQRLAIARALFSGAPVLLLDEATSALDTDTEKKLLDNLRTLTDKTVITVTHRGAVLSICDRVMHFGEDGITEG